jgi:RNA polymerase sigma-70 factor (ECF subfamily)
MPKPDKKFSKVYDQYVNKIYRFIFLKVNSQAIAEDLTSETFLRCWESLKKSSDSNPGIGGIENIQSFLYKIARNLVIDHYREKGKAQIMPVEYAAVIDPKQDLEEKSLFDSDVNQIRLALTDLKEDYQNVIIWHYLDDLPIIEVAKMLGRTEEATRVLLHRALKNLKNKLNQGE